MNRSSAGGFPRSGRTARSCVATVWLLAAAVATARADENETSVPLYTSQLGEPTAGIGAQIEPAARLLPKVVDGRFDLPPLVAISIATDDIGNGRTPEGFRSDVARPVEPLPEDGSQRGEGWNWSVCDWAAANTFSHPRYFEDRMLERHGQEKCGALQPLISGARFFTTVPMLPYLMTVQHPCECEYTLGYYRSGSCAPVMCQRPPWERRAIIVESLSVAGAMIAIP